MSNHVKVSEFQVKRLISKLEDQSSINLESINVKDVIEQLSLYGSYDNYTIFDNIDQSEFFSHLNLIKLRDDIECYLNGSDKNQHLNLRVEGHELIASLTFSLYLNQKDLIFNKGHLMKFESFIEKYNLTQLEIQELEKKSHNMKFEIDIVETLEI